jgi:hypothetical protein
MDGRMRAVTTLTFPAEENRNNKKTALGAAAFASTIV